MPIVIVGRIVSGMGGAGIMAMSSIIITGTPFDFQHIELGADGIKTLCPGEMSRFGEPT